MVTNPVVRRLKIIRLAIRLYRIFKRIQHLQTGGENQAKVQALYAWAGREIREVAYELCGAIVKAGQFLSLRQELFPQAFTRELQGLQDEVPPVPFSFIQSSLSATHFAQIDENPIASASLAQVHCAVLTDGTKVAVKVLRPGIERLVKVDLSTLGRVVRIINRVPGLRKHMDFVALYREFVNTLERELDMRVEAEHLHRFQQSLGEDSRIVIPAVFEDYTTQRVLVMTYLVGANIKDSHQLLTWNINRSAVRDALLDMYLKQILVDGFVHLDPHPGNLLVMPDGRVALLDFGMVGEYSSSQRATFRYLIQAIAFRDMVGVVTALGQLGYVQKDADPAEFAQQIGGTFRGFNATLLRALLANESFQLQAKYMLLVRCLGLLKTVLTTLTPQETDWFGVIAEHVFPVLTEAKRTQSKKDETTVPDLK